MSTPRRHRAMLFLCPAVMVLMAAGSSAHAGLVPIDAVKDNTLYEDPLGALSNGAGAHFFAGRTGQASNSIRRGLIAFDIAAEVPAGATITSVTLTLHASQANTDPVSIGLHRLLADWGEGASDAPGGEGGGTTATPGDATWLHTVSPGSFWSSAGGDFAGAASASTTVADAGFYTWSSAAMIADVQSWLDAPATSTGWALLGDETMSGTTRRFDSRTNPTEAFRPELLVEYTLVPAPGALAVLIGAGLAGRRRRRR